VKNLNLSNNVVTLSHKENVYFNNLFLKFIDSDLKNINYMDNGSISIESTEAFIAIDVNYSLYGNLLSSNAINNINFLAATKIFESIKYYNLSGLIVIDFIGRINDKLDRKIRDQFYDLFDHQSKSKIEGPSPNGIYEITIERNSFDIFYLKKIFS
jgi:ribonuclease G